MKIKVEQDTDLAPDSFILVQVGVNEEASWKDVPTEHSKLIHDPADFPQLASEFGWDGDTSPTLHTIEEATSFLSEKASQLDIIVIDDPGYFH